MPNMLINSASRKLAVLQRYCSATGQLIIILNYVYLETMWETDTTVVIYIEQHLFTYYY